MAKNQVKSLNSKNLSLVKKVGDKIQFTITRFHCTSRFQTKKNKSKYSLKKDFTPMWTQVVEISKLQKPNFTILCCGWLAGCRGWFIDAVLCNSKCHRIMGLKSLWNFIQFLFTQEFDIMVSIIKTLYRPSFWETSTNFSFTAAASKYRGSPLSTNSLSTIPGIVQIQNRTI